MIDPIGVGDSQVSPYERYNQYSQYTKFNPYAGASNTAAGAPVGRISTQAFAPAQANPLQQAAAAGGTPVAAAAAGTASPAGQSSPFGQIPNLLDRIKGAIKKECQSCKNRQYQDQSNDSGVSYQTPTTIDPNQAGAAVRAHEQEHVGRAQAKAQREGRDVIRQSVIIKTSICPECGRVYISGGTTTTMTRKKAQEDDAGSLFRAKQATPGKGTYFDISI